MVGHIEDINCEWAGYVSPSERGPDEVHIPVNLGAVPEELNIGGIYSYGVDKSANADAITGWRRKDLVRLVVYNLSNKDLELNTD